MKIRTAVIGVMLAFTATRPSAASGLTQYKGADGGWLIFSVTASGLTGVDVYVRKIGEEGKGDRITVNPCAGFTHPEDITAPSVNEKIRAQMESAGKSPVGWRTCTDVIVRRLPPGDFELNNVGAGLSGWISYRQNFPNFSAPFTVTTGRATYAGAISAIGSEGKSMFGAPAFGGWSVFIDDYFDRDTAIAQNKMIISGPIDRGPAPSLSPNPNTAPASSVTRP